MKTSVELRAEIADLREELESIVAVSDREERDLTSDETARTSEITSELLPAKNKQLKSVLAIEKERQQRHENRIVDQIGDRKAAGGLAVGTDGGRLVPKFKIPATAKKHGNLRAFTGENAQQDAYVAGNAILAALFNNEKAKQFCAMHGIGVNSALSTSDNSKGGFLVPDEMQRSLIRLREENGIFPRFANLVPMGSDIMRAPRMLEDIDVFWTGEGQKLKEGEIGLGTKELMARKLTALARISSELDEDAVIEVGDIVTASMAHGMARKVDMAGFNGDGTSDFGGVTGLAHALHANAIIDAESGNTSVSLLDLADYHKVMGAIPDYPGAQNRWFMHRSTYYNGALLLMNAAMGNANTNLSSSVGEMFLGHPVTFVPVMPSSANSTPGAIVAYFGDLRLGASYGVRRSVRTEVSAEFYFDTDQIGIKQTERLGILIHETGETENTRPIMALRTALT